MKAGTRLGPSPRLEKTTRPRRKRSNPHSPWQIMVDGRMKELRITSRTLAKALSVARSGIANTTIWAWTTNADGYPPPVTYSEEMNNLLANALQIKPDILAKAYEESRRHLIINDSEASYRGPLRILRRIFADSRQKTWTSKEIIQIIDDIERQ